MNKTSTLLILTALLLSFQTQAKAISPVAPGTGPDVSFDTTLHGLWKKIPGSANGLGKFKLILCVDNTATHESGNRLTGKYKAKKIKDAFKKKLRKGPITGYLSTSNDDPSSAFLTSIKGILNRTGSITGQIAGDNDPQVNGSLVITTGNGLAYVLQKVNSNPAFCN